MSDYDIQRLHDSLTDKFIWYQYRLDCPMPSPDETQAMMQAKYLTDPIFHARVATLVAGVINTVQQWLQENRE
jgi:hypothetical protein